MPGKSEASRQKELKQAVREDARRKVRESLPVPVAVMKGLFDHVDAQLAQQKCDPTSAMPANSFIVMVYRKMLLSTGSKITTVICDCEVVFNSEEILEDAVPGYHDIEPSGNRS